MPRSSLPLNAFNAGELSPEVFGRTDIDKYKSGAATLRNFIVHPEGGIFRRPGTRYSADVWDHTKKSRVVAFTFSTEQAYTLEFSDLRMRVFANEALLSAPVDTFLDAAVDTTTDEIAITDHGYIDSQGPVRLTSTGTLPAGLATGTDYYIVSPATKTFLDGDVNTTTNRITITAHGYTDQQGPFQLTTTGVLPIGLEAVQDYYAQVVDANTIELSTTPTGAAVNITSAALGGTHTLTPLNDYVRDKLRLSLTAGGSPVDITAAAGGGTHTITPTPSFPLEVITPFTEAQLFDLHFVQSADILFIAHKSHRPTQISRRGNTKWSVDIFNNLDGPYLSPNATTTTLAPSAATGNITISASSVNGINDGAGFVSADIGRLIWMKVSGNDLGWVEITGVESTTKVHALVRSATVVTTATTNWRLGAWYTDNYPASVSFFEQRLAFAGEPKTPQTLHASKSGDFNNFSPTQLDGTVLDDNGLDFQIGANQVSAIRWLAVGRQLFMGTGSGPFVVQASSNNESVTPFNINVPQANVVGASSVQPVNVGNQVLYVSRNSRSVLGLQFNISDDGFDSVDLTLLSKHLFSGTKTVVDAAYQLETQSVVWFVRSDGTLVGCTYIPNQQVFAWHQHVLGGAFGSGQAVVESVAVIPSPNSDYDQVWMTVKRTINGATKRFVEFFEEEWVTGVKTDMHYVDAAPVSYSGTPISTLSTGLSHLEAESVQILADGAVHPNRTVTSGSITLDAAYSDITVGLGYSSDYLSLPLDVPDAEGAATSKVARIDHLVLKLHESLGGKIGADFTNMDRLVERSGSDPMDASPPIFTGERKEAFRGAFARDKRIAVRQDQPLPLNILSLTARLSLGAR